MKRSALLGMMALAAFSTQARAQAIFSGRGESAVLDCRGGPAVVIGSGNRLTIGGDCRSLTINGSGNAVAIDLAPGRPLSVSGNGNQVLYRSPAGPPDAQASGAGNAIAPDTRPGTAAMPPAPPPLLLDAASPYSLDCTGRDVTVQGDGLRFVLLGGCRSLTVQGRSDRITAELLPGAPLLVGGAGVIVNYVLVAEGPAPVVRVTAPGLKATQIQHYGESQLKLPTYP